jgi:hypothetical protein
VEDPAPGIETIKGYPGVDYDFPGEYKKIKDVTRSSREPLKS